MEPSTVRELVCTEIAMSTGNVEQSSKIAYFNGRDSLLSEINAIKFFLSGKYLGFFKAYGHFILGGPSVIYRESLIIVNMEKLSTNERLFGHKGE